MGKPHRYDDRVFHINSAKSIPVLGRVLRRKRYDHFYSFRTKSGKVVWQLKKKSSLMGMDPHKVLRICVPPEAVDFFGPDVSELIRDNQEKAA